MTLWCCKDETSWLERANAWISEHCGYPEVRRILVPAGETPKALYAHWEKSKPAFLRDRTLVQIDDILTGPRRLAFRRFFAQHLPSYQEQMEYFESGERAGDIALLGLGMNGHVAFHEPGLSSDFYSGCVRLSEATRAVLNLREETWGMTFGLAAIRQARAILLLVRGEKKRSILERVLRGEDVPAAALLRHANMTILTDFEITPPVS